MAGGNRRAFLVQQDCFPKTARLAAAARMRSQSAAPPAPASWNCFPGSVLRNGVRGWRLERWRSSEPIPGDLWFFPSLERTRKGAFRRPSGGSLCPRRQRNQNAGFPAPLAGNFFRRANLEWLSTPLPGHWALMRQKFRCTVLIGTAWLVPRCLAEEKTAGRCSHRPPKKRRKTKFFRKLFAYFFSKK